ncbi:hypothetical protein [Arenibaculum pallidiluteum]|uniref:hypothetical protein n=1 Tax=Arenibaculum pallidiluteum TaxID=2812559 RepID=UPI001A97D0EF|nr:hypothetical protein [Arenibaculum pallidiluteum]
MTDNTTIYGNAPEGEYNAMLVSAEPARFNGSKAPNRFVVGFALMNEQGTDTCEDPNGDTLYAVAVCNITKGGFNPKSKSVKIRKALLTADEYDPFKHARWVPEWDHFLKLRPDGTSQVFKIRTQWRSEGRKAVSVVTHIQRPRDGQWACIEGEFEGPNAPSSRRREIKPAPEAPKEPAQAIPASSEGSPATKALPPVWTERPPFKWLSRTGKRLTLTDDQINRLPAAEVNLYFVWDRSGDKSRPWFDQNSGELLTLDEAALSTFGLDATAQYKVDHLKAFCARELEADEDYQIVKSLGIADCLGDLDDMDE